MKDAPRSYKDPQYATLDSSVEQKLGLPSGLLASIRLHGERSNADQVSEAGARTVYQITPTTRKLVLDKYGVDAYLSPENAAEAAGLLLKEGLERNKGDAALAAAEYHGGTDRKNWGPRTRAYVARVSKALGAEPAAPAPDAAGPQAGQSTFQRVLARQQAQMPSEPQIASIFQAYQSGQMTQEEAAEFEADVRSGALMLPRGAALKGEEAATPAGAPQADANIIPDGVIEAYVDGRMTPQERAEFEQDVRAGTVQLPDGLTLDIPQEEPGLMDRVAAIPGAIREAVTGEQRRTGETESLPDWATMPELNSFSLASAKTGLGTLLSNPEETVQVIQANFPGVQVRQDEMGNYLLRSSIDGNEYAIKPGFRASDVPRAAGAIAAFTPAGRATTIVGGATAAAGTQAAIEFSQAATGGEIDPAEIATAGAFGGAVPAISRAIRYGAGRGRQLLQRVRGVAQAAPDSGPVPPTAPQTGPAVAPAPAPVPQTAPAVTQNPSPTLQPAPMPTAELAATARKAAEGSGRATQVLAQQAAPDDAVVAAARRLGIEDYLQPDHVTTNQAYRELAQAVKSIPGSEARAAEIRGLERVGQRADDLITEIGGTRDLSTLDAAVRGRMQQVQAELERRADDLYAQVKQGVPARTGAPARNVLSFIDGRAKDLGGPANLSQMEKQILSKLSPKPVRGEGGRVLARQQPTYALLDDVRKDLGAAARGAGPFKDADTGLAKKLYGLLSDDQAAVVERLGMADTYNAARQAVAVRKGLEDDMVSLFGRQLDRSVVGDLNNAMTSLSKGDAQKLVKLLQAIPQEMRQNVVASGLNTAFGKATQNGSLNFNTFARWYEGLLQNRQAHAALMANLPPRGRKQLSDLYRVASAVSKATRERITTGRIQAVTEELKGADTLMANLYGLAKRTAVAAPVEAATTAAGMPGTGLAAALGSALTKGKPNALKAADELISSPEFIALAKQAGKPGEAAAVRRFAYSKAFTRFVRAIGQPRELSNRERWVLQALQAQNQQRQ